MVGSVLLHEFCDAMYGHTSNCRWEGGREGGGREREGGGRGREGGRGEREGGSVSDFQSLRFVLQEPGSKVKHMYTWAKTSAVSRLKTAPPSTPSPLR